MEKLKAIDKRLITILLIVFVQILGASLILPILPLYAKNQFQMKPQIITMLVSVFFGAQFIAGPFLGRWSDVYGRVPVLIISQIGTVISFLMLAFAPNITVLFLARILDGLTGGNIIVAQAYVTDITPREKRTESLGYVFAVFGTGFIFGPALGGFLSTYGPQVPFILAALAATAVVFLTWRTLDETISKEQQQANRDFKGKSLTPKQIIRNRNLIMVLTITFVGQFAFGMLQSTFALYGEAIIFAGEDANTINIGVGLLLSVVGIAQLLTQTVLLKRLLKWLGETRLVVFGATIRAFSSLLFAIISSPFLAVIGSITFALGSGTMMPTLQSLSTETVPDQMRGGVLGIYQSTISLGIILGTGMAGFMFAVSPRLPYWVGGITTLVALIPAILLVQRLGKPADEIPALGGD